MKIEGEVFTGMGVGQEYLELEPYQRKIEEITGFRPFPGTLNLRTDEEKVKEVLEESEAFRIESFDYSGESYSGIDVYPAKIGEVKVAVLRMDVTDYGPEVVEVVAEEKLRDQLGLEDGDSVVVRFE
ncbi:MAG: DUF120 domain-containing protein [Candidatus Nanosalina sp.]